jgi:hypothetical protein
MKRKGKQKRPESECDFHGNLVRFMARLLKDNGIRYQKITFLADAPWPLLPHRYAACVDWYRKDIFLTEVPWRSHCVWEDPEGYTDILDSVERWIKSILEVPA